MTRLVFFCITLLCSSTASAALSQSLDFQILLDDKQIGSHTFEITAEEDQVEVHSTANMEVKVLFVPVFKYKHEAKEVWQGSCLQQIESATRVQGKQYTLRGRETPVGFVVASTQDKRPLVTDEAQGCVSSYAYWDKERLQRDVLVNSQTGQLSFSQLQNNGEQLIPNSTVSAQQFALKTDEADILLWYDTDGRWVALQTETNGRTLNYISRALLGK